MNPVSVVLEKNTNIVVVLYNKIYQKAVRILIKSLNNKYFFLFSKYWLNFFEF